MVLTVLQARNVGSGRDGASFSEEDIHKCLLPRPSLQVPRQTPQASPSARQHNAFWPLDGGHLSEKEEGRVEDEGREREGGKVEAGQSCRLAEPGKPEENVCHHPGNQNWRGGGERQARRWREATCG